MEKCPFGKRRCGESTVAESHTLRLTWLDFILSIHSFRLGVMVGGMFVWIGIIPTNDLLIERFCSMLPRGHRRLTSGRRLGRRAGYYNLIFWKLNVNGCLAHRPRQRSSAPSRDVRWRTTFWSLETGHRFRCGMFWRHRICEGSSDSATLRRARGRVIRLFNNIDSFTRFPFLCWTSRF